MNIEQSIDYQQLAKDIKQWGLELGFQEIAITDTNLANYEKKLFEWLAKGYHGDMEYMERYGTMRSRPEEFIAETKSIIMARIDYLPPTSNSEEILQDSNKAYISRYALGRDYHKLIRKRLTKLVDKITEVTGPFISRPFADSAPVMEKPLAEKAGLGWIGKNTLLINRDAGSWFFLGTLYTSLPLPCDEVVNDHCGTCQACIDVCPTKAIVGPYQLDASRCISNLTIENHGPIPEEFRKAMGNRIFGCDDCQLFCPWNRFAKFTDENDFHPRHTLDDISLLELFAWNEAEFLQKTAGSAIRRIGHERWLRNIAVALGNAETSTNIIQALVARQDHSSELVREHVEWALRQHNSP